MSESAEPARRKLLSRVRDVFAPTSAEPEPVEAPPPLEESEVTRVSGTPFRTGFYGALGVLIAVALSEAVLAIQNILLLVVLSFVLALGASPLVNYLDRRMNRTVAMALVTIAVLSVVTLGLWAVFPLLIEQATMLIRNLPVMLDNLAQHSQVQALNERWHVIDKLQETLRKADFGPQVFNGVMGAGAVVVNFVFSVIITLVLTLYFLASLDKIKQLVYGLAPASKRRRARYLANEIFRGVSGYIQGMGILVSMATVSTFIFLNIVGLSDYAVALSFMHGLLCFIPVVGPPTGAVIVSLIAFSTGNTTGIATAIFFVVYQQLDAYVFYPNVMKRTVKVPGVLVVLSAMIGGVLLGIIGAVLAIPTAAAIILLWRELVQPALDAQ